MELIVCMMLASLITGFRPISDLVHLAKGQEPPHLTKARLRAETEKAKAAARQAKAENRKVRPADGKPTIGDVWRVYWGDALQDTIDAHDRRRAEKKAQQQENQAAEAERRPAKQVRPGWKQRLARFGQLLVQPVGDTTPADADTGVEEPAAPVCSCGLLLQQRDGVWKHPDGSPATHAGPRLTCDVCGAEVGADWKHPPGSTCTRLNPEPRQAATTAQQQADDPALRLAAELANTRRRHPMPDTVCPRCEQTAVLTSSGACQPCLNRPGSARAFWQRHVDAAKNAYDRGDWATADRHLAAIEDHLPGLYRNRAGRDTQVDIRQPDTGTRVNNGYQRMFLPDWRADIQRRIHADNPAPNEGDPVTTSASTAAAAGGPTGEAVNYETAMAELDKLEAAQQAHLDQAQAALEEIRQAKARISDTQATYRPAAEAAELMHQHLTALGIDQDTAAATGTIADAMPPNRVDQMLDHLESMEADAQQQVANAETALAATHVARSSLVEKYGEANNTVQQHLGGDARFLAGSGAVQG